MSHNVIVLSIEGVSTAQVGAYGSNTSQTKSIDAIAARGIVLDHCFLDSRDPVENLRSLWTCQHAIRRADRDDLLGAPPVESIWSQLKGASAALVTDCSRAAELAEQLGCPRVLLIESTGPDQPAEEVTQTAFFSLLATAAEAIEQFGEATTTARIVWIHSRGLRQPWDAPTNLRSRFKDADDPEPPTELGPPFFEVDSNTDPDLVLGWTHAAAAQVGVFDEGVDFLRDFVEQLDPSWAWCILGLNAFPLGEQGCIGDGVIPLSNHQLQVVAILSPQPQLPIGWRVGSICQLPDVGASIAQMCGVETVCGVSSQNPDGPIVWAQAQLDPPDDQPPSQWDCRLQSAMVVEPTGTWLRAPAWSLRLGTDDSSSLFVQPDDHWEINEVGSLCREVIEELQAASQSFIQAAKTGDRSQLPKLNEASCNILR